MSDISHEALDWLESVIDRKIQKALLQNVKTQYKGRVLSKDADGVVWVEVPGIADRLPADISLVEVGNDDLVQVTIDNGAAIIDGNQTSPAVNATIVENVTVGIVAPIEQTLKTIVADQASFKVLQAEYANIVNATIQELVAGKADIDFANITFADIDQAFVNALNANYAHITNGTIDNATIGYADVNGLNANYAQIDLANIANGTIKTAMIDDGQITSAKIQDAAITTAKIGDAQITTAKIGDAQVTNAKIGSAAVGTANIQGAAITTALIADAAVSNEKVISVSANKLTAGTIDASNINVTNLRADNLVVTKLNGQPVIGGYAVVSKDISGYSSKNPSTEGWYEFFNGSYSPSSDTSVDSSKVYYSTSESVELYDQSTIDGMVEDLNDRIDAQIETWTEDHVPTLSNSPASSWTTNDLKAEHVGDICYVLNAGSDYDGYTYRFAYDQSTSSYGWVLIKDNQVTAALGRITDLETFETNISSWKTETDTELTQARGSYTSLAGRIGADETAISAKVETSTFNTLSNTVDSNTATITQLSTIAENNGLTSSTNITNTVNTVSQTATSNSSTISSLTSTLGTNSDGTTKAGDVMHRMTSAETGITQNASAIALRATKTEMYGNAQPNLTPFFDSHNADGTYPNGGVGGYWQPSYEAKYSRTGFTALYDGWAHVSVSSTTQHEFVPPRANGLASGDRVTMLVEWRNASTTGNGANFYTRNYVNNVQINANWYFGPSMTGASGELRHTFTVNSTADGLQTWNGLVDVTFPCKDSSSTFEGDIRISFYKEAYDSSTSSYVQYAGPWKPYSGNQLYASQAELKVANDNIELKVSQTDYNGNTIASLINQSADTVKIQASHVEIDGTTKFSNTTLSGYLSANYDAAGSASAAQAAAISAAATDATNKVNAVQVGGRNLLANTSDEWTEVSLTTSQYFLEVHTDYALEIGQQYTFSIIVEKVSSDTVAINLHLGNGLQGQYTHDIGAWRQNSIPFGEVVSITHTITEADLAKTSSDTTIAPYLSFRLRNEKNATTIRYRCVKLEKGNKATDWTPAPEDVDSAISTAQSTANGANSQEQLIYCSKASGTTSLSATTTWITATGDTQNAWTLRRPTYSQSYPVLFVATQRKTVGGTVTCTTPQIDNTTTVIDGGNIITGSITATQINTSTITIGSLGGSISATNLIRNGDFSNGTSYWDKASSADTYAVESDSTHGKALKFVQSAAGSNSYRIYTNISTSFTHVSGETYSISFYAKALASNTIQVTLAGSLTTGRIYVNEPVTTSWKRYTGTITADASGSLTFWLANAGTLYLAEIMLVHGEMPIGWSPDPRDTQYITSTANTANNRAVAYRGTCSTAAATAAKTVTCSYFALATGATVECYCSTANTADVPTLNVNGTGAKAIWINGAAASDANPCKWQAGDTVTFTYDGTRFRASLPVENYITADSSGIKVHNAGDDKNYAHITSSGMEVYKNVSNTATSVASFGDTARIGKASGESRMELDYHSLQLIDKEGDAYFHVSDLRDSSGGASFTETFFGDNFTKRFWFNFPAVNTSYAVTVYNTSDADVTSSYSITKETNNVFFATAIPENYRIVVSYSTASQETKAFTFGARKANSDIGGYSFVQGYDNISTGFCSYAEGNETTAFDQASHAEGYKTIAGASSAYRVTGASLASHAEGFGSNARGYGAHAEGSYTKAFGDSAHAEGDGTIAYDFGHAQNYFTIATKFAQTALGTYNVEDTASTTTHPSTDTYYGTYAVIVGNGTTDNARSNAAALQWDGTLELAKALPIASGGTGQTTAADARTALGLGTFATKSSINIGYGGPTGSTKDSTARASGANYTVNITVAAETNQVPAAVCAVVSNNANAVLRGFDLDGISNGSAATLKTYWHANAALSANSVTYTAQILYLKVSLT